MEGGERDEPSRQKGGGKVKKGVIFFLLALSVLMIRSEYGDLPASLYGIFMGWTFVYQRNRRKGLLRKNGQTPLDYIPRFGKRFFYVSNRS